MITRSGQMMANYTRYIAMHKMAVRPVFSGARRTMEKAFLSLGRTFIARDSNQATDTSTIPWLETEPGCGILYGEQGEGSLARLRWADSSVAERAIAVSTPQDVSRYINKPECFPHFPRTSLNRLDVALLFLLLEDPRKIDASRSTDIHMMLTLEVPERY